MKNRTSLVLMEQLVMVLVFALAAAVCLQLFAKADAISCQTARRDEAVILAQSVAEQLKSGVQPEQLSENPEQGGYIVKIHPVKTEIPGLAQAQIHILWESEVLFSLTTGWQEELP